MDSPSDARPTASPADSGSGTAAKAEASLVMRGMSKRFGEVQALDDVSFSVRTGEIHALLGENGAGKSTLMEIAYGLCKPDRGTIEVDGVERKMVSPRVARQHGLGMVHQEFALVDTFTVVENVALEEGWRRAGRLRFTDVRSRVEAANESYALNVPLGKVVRELSVGERQRAELLKLLIREVSVFVLDEPTSLLTPRESESLFEVMRGLQTRGRSVVFITHKLPEVVAVANTVSVLRRGRMQGTSAVGAVTEDELRGLMVGDTRLAVALADPDAVAQDRPARPLADMPEGAGPSEGRPGLWIDDVSIEAGRSALLSDVTFGIRPGEIVGLAAVSGNGQKELIEALVGLQEISSGEIWLDGERIDAAPHRSVISRGIAYIPDDRRNGGLVMGFTIAENLMLRERLGGDLTSGGFVRRGRVKRSARVAMEKYSIAAPNPDVKVGNLSGGNQQKVVLARELGRDPKVIIAAEPTRGLDFATTAYVHSQLRERCASGASVLVSSTNLDEILSLSDRIVVLYQRRIAGIVPREQATLYGVGSLMTGEGQSRLAGEAA